MDSTYTIRGAGACTEVACDRSGEPIAEYAGVSPTLKYWNYVRPDGVVIGRREGSNRFFYHRDHPSLCSGQVWDHPIGLYMPGACPEGVFDRRGEFMSGRITTSGTGTRPKFTGHAFDDETNLHNMQWRRQIPRYGVFRTPDPMADSYPGWNPYAYVMNDPMRYLDPTGLAPCEAGTARVEGITCYQSDEVITVRAWQNDFANSFYGFFDRYYARYGDPGPSVTNDQFMRVLDVAGSIDPTGVVDLASATIYAFQGDFVNASISAASILPAGDLLKASRIATKGAAKTIGKSINQLNKAVQTGKAPNGITRFDKGRGTLNLPQDEVHFKDGSSLYRDGTWRHDNGHILTNDQINFLKDNGWNIP